MTVNGDLDALNTATAALLFVASALGFSVAIRGLRAAERDAGRLEAEGVNGPAQAATEALITTERIRVAARALLALVAVVMLLTEPSPGARLAIVLILAGISVLEDVKSLLWNRARRRVVAMERERAARERAARERPGNGGGP